MTEILDCYSINENTLVIMPAFNIEYESIIIELESTLYVKQSPLQIIKENCLENAASYEGRRRSVVHLTGFSRCVPIPINPRKDIFTFPTHSPKNMNCSWVFFKYIEQIERGKNKTESIVHLINGRSITFDISFHTLFNQKFRTFVCRQKVLGLSSTHYSYSPLS